jgi:hypothetical protein
MMMMAYLLLALVLSWFCCALTLAAPPQCGSAPTCCASARVIVDAFGSSPTAEHDVNVFTAIAFYESTWGQKKGPNRNTDGSADVGLLQLNDYICCSSSGNQKDCCCPNTYPSCRTDATKRKCASECGISCEVALKNDTVNAQCARRHKEGGGCGGYKCWEGYNSHKADCEAFQNLCRRLCTRKLLLDHFSRCYLLQ